MANLLLTQQCNRSCPYCFASGQITTSASDNTLSWKNLAYVVNLLKSAGDDRVFFLGGEPSLHPELIEYSQYCISRGVGVTIFTNGIWSKDLLKDAKVRLSRIPEGILSFVCNVNQPNLSNSDELEQTKTFLDAFRSRVTLSFNIFQPGFDIKFLFEYISRYDLNKNIRLGFAHPLPETHNQHVSVADMQQTVQQLMSYRSLFEKNDVHPLLDCGFPRCLFTEDDINWLTRLNRVNAHFGCSPIIDISTDMHVWACFPLSKNTKKSVYDFDSLTSMYDYYESYLEGIRQKNAGIFPACLTCRLREDGLCAGGCAAHAMSNSI